MLNRFTVQILATVDAEDMVVLHQTIKTALASIPKMNLKAINLDKWTDGYTGKDRMFLEDGSEYREPEPEIEVPKQETEDQETEEVTIEQVA